MTTGSEITRSLDGKRSPRGASGETARANRRRAVPGDDRGMTTAEYAVGTVAACGFGAVLYKAVTSDTVGRLLRGVLEQALSVGFL